MWRSPAFWWKKDSDFRAYLLSPFSLCISLGARWRLRRTGQSFPDLPILCVGNFVVGGAGKTPFALHLADVLEKMGLCPAFLTRGYGGQLTGPVCVDRHYHTAQQVGDESLLLAQHALTILACNRPKGVLLAKKNGANIIIMDDGCQNPSLKKTLCFMVIDAERGLGNGWVLPSGPLRAPLQAQLEISDVLVLMGTGPRAAGIRSGAEKRKLPLLVAKLDAQDKMYWSGRRVLAFAGIGVPKKFFQSLKELGAELVEVVDFPDHHFFTPEEARALLKCASEKDLLLVTTEKDHVRLSTAQHPALQELAEKSQSLKIHLILTEGDLGTLLKEKLNLPTEEPLLALPAPSEPPNTGDHGETFSASSKTTGENMA